MMIKMAVVKYDETGKLVYREDEMIYVDNKKCAKEYKDKILFITHENIKIRKGFIASDIWKDKN